MHTHAQITAHPTTAATVVAILAAAMGMEGRVPAPHKLDLCPLLHAWGHVNVFRDGAVDVAGPGARAAHVRTARHGAYSVAQRAGCCCFAAVFIGTAPRARGAARWASARCAAAAAAATATAAARARTRRAYQQLGHTYAPRRAPRGLLQRQTHTRVDIVAGRGPARAPSKRPEKLVQDRRRSALREACISVSASAVGGVVVMRRWTGRARSRTGPVV